MKKLFENWRKSLNEAEYEPGRAVADIDTGEDYVEPQMAEKEAMEDLADKFNVQVMFAKTTDGKHIAVATFEDGETMAYIDEEEMYQDLASRQEMNEGAVPHSAHHVVKKMKKTGLSAKEALKSLTTDLSDEEAERWLKRHKDEMDSAMGAKETNEELRDYTGGQSRSPDLQIPGYGIMTVEQVERKLARMLQEAAEDAAKDPPQYSHLNNGVIQSLHKALKDFKEL